MVQPGSFFIEGVVLLHKASQSVSLTVTVMNSNKMLKKEKKKMTLEETAMRFEHV